MQGAFREHQGMLGRLGIESLLVSTVAELNSCEALIIPGGESTTIGRLLNVFGLADPVRERVQAGMSIFGTCAGMILMAKEIEGSTQARLGLMDIVVRRNAFGRQVESFEASLKVPAVGNELFRGIFIRAPFITRVGPQVEVLCRIEDRAVLVRQNNLLAASFHPELTDDLRLHRYFLSQVVGLMISGGKGKK